MAEKDPKIKQDIKQIIEDEGFIFESHQVTTHDQYNLTLHRV